VKAPGLALILLFLFVNSSCLNVHMRSASRLKVYVNQPRSDKVFLRLRGGDGEVKQDSPYSDYATSVSLNHSHASGMHSNGSHISIREEDSTIFDDSDLDIPRRAQDQTSTASQHILSRPSARHLSPRSLRVKRNLLSSVHQGQDSRVPARVSHVIESVISICSREVCYMNETLDASPGDIRHRDFESISFGDVLALLGPSAFPVLFLLLSLPSALGLPGVGMFVGIGQFCLSCQMISGSRIPVLPEWIRKTRMKKRYLVSILSSGLPAIRATNKFAKHRWTFMQNPAVEQALAIFMLQLSVVVMLPIPFSTQLPAICMALIALGIAELDGLFVVAGLLLAVLSEILVFAILRTMTSFLLSTFGFKKAVPVPSAPSDPNFSPVLRLD